MGGHCRKVDGLARQGIEEYISEHHLLMEDAATHSYQQLCCAVEILVRSPTHHQGVARLMKVARKCHGHRCLKRCFPKFYPQMISSVNVDVGVSLLWAPVQHLSDVGAEGLMQSLDMVVC